jgi:hypothetical protein
VNLPSASDESSEEEDEEDIATELDYQPPVINDIQQMNAFYKD